MSLNSINLAVCQYNKREEWGFMCRLKWLDIISLIRRIQDLKPDFFMTQQPPSGPGPRPYRCFTITLRHTHTLVTTPLDEWSPRRIHHYLTSHNTHNRHTSMLPAGFELTIPGASDPDWHLRPHSITGNSSCIIYSFIYSCNRAETCSLYASWI